MKNSTDLFLGIDGGGTGCRALLCDHDGNALGAGQSGSANVMTGFDGAMQNILDASRQALEQAELHNYQLHDVPVFMGLAGADFGDGAERLRSSLPFKRCIVETDAVASLEGAIGHDDGVAAIIGTGTVFAHRKDGVFNTVGGWGFVVGDLASGAWIGRRLLQEVLLCYDGVREGSPLTERVLEDFRHNPQTVVEYAYTAKPGEFGKFAPLVFEHTGQRDPIARRIVNRAVSDIEATLDKIVQDDNSRLCMIGGLGRVYANLLSSYYRERVREPIADAVTGAAKLAIRHFGREGA